MFYSSNQYLNLKYLEFFAEEIKREFDSVTHFKKWPETEKYAGKWDVYGLYHSGRNLKPSRKICPVTNEILDNFQKLVDSKIMMAGFSRLSAGSEILPHIDKVDIDKRIHLGIKIPEGDCGFEVDEIQTKWQEGISFVFDPRKIHRAWNHTSQDRIVLLLDFKDFS